MKNSFRADFTTTALYSIQMLISYIFFYDFLCIFKNFRIEVGKKLPSYLRITSIRGLLNHIIFGDRRKQTNDVHFQKIKILAFNNRLKLNKIKQLHFWKFKKKLEKEYFCFATKFQNCVEKQNFFLICNANTYICTILLLLFKKFKVKVGLLQFV